MVEKLLAAGATITGKTICDEFFYSVAGMNAHYGTPANIRAPGRIPGGSSSGSAAATAAGVCDFALGSDTGGSVRIPASLCGLYGIRTTHGRIGTAGVMDMSPSFDTIGWFAASAGVFRKVGAVLLGGARSPAPIQNLLIADDGFAEADGPVVALAQRRAAAMAVVLPKAQHVKHWHRTDLDAWRDAVRIIQAYEIWQVYGHFVEKKHRASGRASPSACRPRRRSPRRGRRSAESPWPPPASTSAP